MLISRRQETSIAVLMGIALLNVYNFFDSISAGELGIAISHAGITVLFLDTRWH